MADTDDTHKMLRTIINGQSSFRQEVLGKIDKLDKKIDGVEERLTKRVNGAEKNIAERIDKIGKQLAYLEDDAPTTEEFGNLTNRVDKLEHNTIPV